MVTSEYQKYIKSERWKAKCKLFWEVNGRWCRGCRTTRGALHVHHITYDRLGNEALSDLRGLCSKCHKEVHELHWKMGKSLPAVTVYNAFIAAKVMKRNKSKRL
jgi:5-methylcytosine-specific restriction endonuclease McrA